LKRKETARNAARIAIGDQEYVPAQEVGEHAGISRTTLWRWRADGKIPTGFMYRDKQLVFTVAEAQEIYAYANRLEPAPSQKPQQLRLFGGGKRVKKP
jgi:predicted DNA-binding transcriptional regulator AlpA